MISEYGIVKAVDSDRGTHFIRGILEKDYGCFENSVGSPYPLVPSEFRSNRKDEHVTKTAAKPKNSPTTIFSVRESRYYFILAITCNRNNFTHTFPRCAEQIIP